MAMRFKKDPERWVEFGKTGGVGWIGSWYWINLSAYLVFCLPKRTSCSVWWSNLLVERVFLMSKPMILLAQQRRFLQILGAKFSVFFLKKHVLAVSHLVIPCKQCGRWEHVSTVFHSLCRTISNIFLPNLFHQISRQNTSFTKRTDCTIETANSPKNHCHYWIPRKILFFKSWLARAISKTQQKAS